MLQDSESAPAEPEILVIEASEFFREAIGQALRAAGHVCRTAVDLEAAALEWIDPAVGLVILDLGTTGAAGIELLRTLRQQRPATRAIVLSTQVGQQEVLAALHEGASDYLAKPLHEEELRLSVGRALAGWRADVELSRLRAEASPAEAPSGDDCDLALARDLCEAVVEEGDSGRLPGALLGILAERLSATGAALYLSEPGQGSFVREAVWEQGAIRDREWLPAGRGIAGAAATTGVFVASADPESDPRFDPEVDRPAEGKVGALLCLPLRFRRNTVGLVRVFFPAGVDPSLRTAEIASAALSAALRSVLLYRSWRSSIDEVARIRREKSAAGPGVPGWKAPSPSRSAE